MLNYLKTHKKRSLAIILGLVLLGYYLLRPNTPDYQEYTVESGSVRDTLELSGKVEAGSSAVLRFPAGGLVTYLGAKEGDSVKKWQTLASIDTRQLQKTLEQKLNLYAIARGSFEQTIDDTDNSVPDGDLARELKRILEKNQYQLDNAVKDVEYLDLSLKLSRLSSPISGILVHAPLTTSGAQVLGSDSWIVVDPTTLYFSADLDETDLRRVTLGQKVEIKLDAYPDKTFASTVTSIAYSPKETSSGTVYELKLMLPKDSLADLRLGLNGTATLILTEKDSILRLPSNAISFEGANSYVLLKDGNDYRKQDITLGIENDGYAEITKGVSQGDRVYIEKTQ